MSTISYTDNNGNPINFDTAIVAGKANTRINRQLTLNNGAKRRWLWAATGTIITPEMAAQVAADLNINPPETNPNTPTTSPAAAYMPTLMNTPSMGDIIAWDALNARPYALSRTALKGAPGNDGVDGTPGTAGQGGATAYDLAVAAGFTGPLNDWLASLKGQPGTPGADSTTPGPKGDPGSTGQRGPGWTSGTGLPTTIGINQDSYTDLTNGYVYRYLNGAWLQIPNVSMMGPAGKDGTPGNTGQAATVTIASTTTGTPGSNAIVTNLGNSTTANLAFTIPQGAPGKDGKDGTPGNAGQNGQAATIAIDSVTTGPIPTVANIGTNTAAKLRFTLPATSTTVNARVDTPETISVTNFANLTTPGPTCNIICGPQGILTVTISGNVTINGRMTAQITQGASIIFAAHESFSIYSSGGNIQGSRTRTWTGLTPGLTYTITAMYNAPLLGNATFAYREITATTR